MARVFAEEVIIQANRGLHKWLKVGASETQRALVKNSLDGFIGNDATNPFPR